MEGNPRLIALHYVSRNYFQVLGIEASRGRVFSPESESSEAPAIVLSYALWQGSFGGNPGLVGKSVVFNGRSYAVIGIAPPSFTGLAKGLPVEAWLPLSVSYSPAELASRKFRDLDLVGRLKESASARQARTQLTAIATRLANEYPASNAARSFGLVSESQRLRKALVPTSLLLALTGLVLLIACANIAGLLVAQSETRRREIAVRFAIGASRWRLVRQILTESALLGLAGAAAAVWLASLLVHLQPAVLPPAPIPVGASLRNNGSVAVFTVAVSVVAVLIFGLAPAIPASKMAILPALKNDGGRVGGRSARHRMRGAFVVGEVALAVVLMSAAGLLLESLLRTLQANLGFDWHEKLLLVDLSPRATVKNGKPAEPTWEFHERFADGVAALPGARRATFAMRPPLGLSGGGATVPVSIPGVEFPQGQPTINIKFNSVAPNYFHVMRTTIMRGRAFAESDGPAAAKVAIVDEAMEHRFWPKGDAIGNLIVVDGVQFRIVGIAENARIEGVHEPPEPYIYFPFAQEPVSEGTLIVETARSPRALAPEVRRKIESLNPGATIVEVMTMSQLMQDALWSDRTAVGLAAGLSLLGVFLAAIGLYGVVAHLVNGRTQEIGLRMALGAQRREVLRLVVGQGLRLAALGGGVGLLLAIGAMRLMASLLHGVSPDDPAALGAAFALALTVALAASYMPARRAMRVDPASALRSE